MNKPSEDPVSQTDRTQPGMTPPDDHPAGDPESSRNAAHEDETADVVEPRKDAPARGDDDVTSLPPEPTRKLS